MKKKILVIIIAVCFLIECALISFIYIKYKNDNSIKPNYIVVFKGESSNVVHSTYIYEVKNKKGKVKSYKYINTISKYTGYGDYDYNETVIKKGKIKSKNKKKKIYKVAKKNNAYSYVKYIKDDKIYSIDEFKKVFGE